MGWQAGSRLGAHPRPSSARMSRSRLFLGGSVSTGAHLRFTGCPQPALQWSCRSSNLQPTAMWVLTVCVSQGDKRTQGLKPAIYAPLAAVRAKALTYQSKNLFKN